MIHLRSSCTVAVALLILGGCDGPQTPLDPAGPQAGQVDRLIRLYGGIGSGVYLAFMAVVLASVFRQGEADRAGPVVEPRPAAVRRLWFAVGASIAVTFAILIVLLLADFRSGRAIGSLAADPDPLTIRVTGRQWWQGVEYLDAEPSNLVIDANEIHLPVGRTVRLELVAMEVIHSFWVPNLHGKRDMIPGRPTHILLRADRPGTFGGQCAEFCGLEHANMRFTVVAEPEDDHRRWLESRRRPAAEPSTDGQRRGQQVLLNTTCVMCHAIRGTPARSRYGPDLSHVGSRRLIGGILPNTRGHLAGWVVNAQGIKPGARMPRVAIEPGDINPLIDYLESLK